MTEKSDVYVAGAASCPLPGTWRPATGRELVAMLKEMPARFWGKAALLSLGAVLLIGLPTVLIPNPVFAREVAARPVDYVLLVLSAVLIGLTWALPAPGDDPEGQTEKRSLMGALGAFFAVGCPTCNKIVLVLLGSSGALTYFAPLQPILGVLALGFIVTALRRRAGQLLPVGSNSAS